MTGVVARGSQGERPWGSPGRGHVPKLPINRLLTLANHVVYPDAHSRSIQQIDARKPPMPVRRDRNHSVTYGIAVSIQLWMLERPSTSVPQA
jgi:hypothetical protein